MIVTWYTSWSLYAFFRQPNFDTSLVNKPYLRHQPGHSAGAPSGYHISPRVLPQFDYATASMIALHHADTPMVQCLSNPMYAPEDDVMSSARAIHDTGVVYLVLIRDIDLNVLRVRTRMPTISSNAGPFRPCDSFNDGPAPCQHISCGAVSQGVANKNLRHRCCK